MKKMSLTFAMTLCSLIVSVPVAFAASQGPAKYVSADTTWTLIGAFLVFVMQPGFAMVETGLTRAKNAANIVMKNFMDFSIGSVVFWFIGFGLMFGHDISGFIGAPDFFVRNYQVSSGAGYPPFTYLIFQTVFCATAATIVSGAMAERTKFAAYCVYSLVISAFVYPISGHWAWGGGWLTTLAVPYHDFAGSSVVHMVGGIAALIGAWMLGPRIGKYNSDGTPNAILGHSMPLAALGVFILWFGWFGFNGGSTVSATGDATLLSISNIYVTTNLAAAVSSCTVMILTWIRYGKPDVSMTLNGGLAGLVGITAGCDAVNPFGAFAIGLICGIVVVFSVEFFDKVAKIDDPVGAISVHGVCGALGTILTGLFAVDGGLFYGGGAGLLVTQLIGVAAIAVYVAIVMYVIFKIIDAVIGLRVSREEEIEGLDIREHGLSSAYASFEPVHISTTLSPVLGVSTTNTAIKSADTDVEVEHRPAVKTSDGHKLTKISIVTSEERFETLKEALEQLGITGMTVTKVLGFGIQKGHKELYRGAAIKSQLLPKIKIDLIVSAVPVDTIVKTAKAVLYTGKYGDGKIFVYDVENVVKIRTGEEGFSALQDKPME
ncbi:ammonium transporter [Pectinatus sottacetonis]|uniref:ammonium transporter n=1 Tax=Pectinatus sottacetonis TaxID=1002795 RepID=UPI001E3AAD16|nr:ammonium transporter [Pectinatus sottacetonis]